MPGVISSLITGHTSQTRISSIGLVRVSRASTGGPYSLWFAPTIANYDLMTLFTDKASGVVCLYIAMLSYVHRIEFSMGDI